MTERHDLAGIGGQRAGTLSGGQKQRLALAAAILHQPELLLLDEPTSTVDPETRRDFWDSLYRLAFDGTSILVSTHFMDEAERCHRLAILDEGRKVADGSPDELKDAIGVAVVEIEVADPERGRAVLSNTTGVVSLAQLGTRLRAHVDPAVGDPVEPVRRAMREADIVAKARTAAELETLLRQGRVSLGILIPHDFERRLVDSDRTAAQLLVDATDPVLLGTAQGLLERELFDAPRLPPADTHRRIFEVRAYYNPERSSEVQIVPGLIGVILTLTMSLFTAVAIVLGLGYFLFHVPVRGSLLDLYLAAAFFITATVALGLLISTAATTQFQSMQMTMFFFLPSILLSGSMFPFEGLPRAAQYIGGLLPLTQFVRMVRGIILRGASIADVGREI